MMTSLSSKNHNIWSLLFKAFLGIQFCLWIYINLRYQIIHNYDQIELIFQSFHPSSQQTLSFSDWNYSFNANFSCSSLLAFLIFFVSGNTLISFSIVNILNIFLFTGVLYLLLTHCGIKNEIACLLIGITFIPFSTGWSAYSNLLFFGDSPFFYTVFLPIWLLELISSSNSRKRWPTLFQTVLFLGLCFLTSISSGLHLFLCGLLPIILCDAVLRLRLDPNAVRNRLILPCLVCLVCLAGYAIFQISKFGTYTDSLSVVTRSSFISNLARNISAIFQLVGALHEETVSVTSFIGILSAVKVFLVIVVVIAGLIPLKSIFSKETYENVCQMRRNNLSLYFSIIACWNFFILQMVESSAYYHLIGLIPLILSASITLYNWFETGGFEKNLTTGMIVLAVFGLAAGCWAVALSSAREHFTDDQESQISAEYSRNLCIITAFSNPNNGDAKIIRG